MHMQPEGMSRLVRDGLLEISIDFMVVTVVADCRLCYLQRTQICYGSIGEVKRFEEFMLGKSERFADAAVKA